MAPTKGKGKGKETVTFDSIIQAGRQKKKNEELASKILGKNRRTGASGSGSVSKVQQAAAPRSLASRIGVTKNQKNQLQKRGQAQSTAPLGAPTGPKSRNRRRVNEDRLVTALNPASGQVNVRKSGGVGMTIKGTSSGPFVVTGANFAPGTTAADIQSALEPVAGEILSCLVTSQHPAVTAEITVAEKQSAESIIANFHNQKADGRVLSMRLKPAGAGSATDHNAYESHRVQADRERQNRRVEPSIQNGSFGFSEQSNGRYNNRQSNRGGRSRGGGRDTGRDTQDSGLYSDQMMVDTPAQNSRNRGRRQR